MPGLRSQTGICRPHATHVLLLSRLRQKAKYPAWRASHTTAALSTPRLEDSSFDSLTPLEEDSFITDVAGALRLKRQREPFDNEYILGLLWQQRGQLACAAVMLLLCTASNLGAPVLSGMLLEALVQQQPIQVYFKLLGMLTVGYVLEPFMTKIYMNAALRAAETVLATLRMELFRTLLMQKVSFFEQRGAAELTSLISVELDTIRSFIFSNVTRDRGLRALLEMVGSVCVLFALSWRLAPVCSIIIVATAVAATIYRRRTREVEQRQGRSLQQMTSVALQALENMRTVRSFAGEALERERFQTHVAQSYKAGLEFASAKAWFEASNRGAIHASLLALYAWGGWLVSSGLMPLRVMVSGIGFTFSLMYATQANVPALSWLTACTLVVLQIRQVLVSSEPDPSMYGALPPGAWWEVANGNAPPVQPYADKAGTAAVEAAQQGPLELRDVTFSYPVRPHVKVLEGLTLTLPRGSVTAVVGRSGAGKSTVAALLSRFYKPQEGAIYLAGRPALSFSRGEWSKAIAMWSSNDLSQVQAAAEAANAHEFIQQLPDGYATVVGERGALLSGGQRQRIAIARALLKDSPIIILDEATSALDSVSEAAVQQAVQRLVHGRTVLVIAHRLSTVQTADQIVVMADGRAVEVGTHLELSAKQGSRYNELMKAQELILASV
ncbi:P-loop containing nucleoside triphosphate hydrolase protein [Haematococcus lacustris]